MDGLNSELARPTVVKRIDPSYESLAMEDRHHVIPVLALFRGTVDLELEAKVEELLGPLAVGDQLVER
jgi:hypothetical protein